MFLTSEHSNRLSLVGAVGGVYQLGSSSSFPFVQRAKLAKGSSNWAANLNASHREESKTATAMEDSTLPSAREACESSVGRLQMKKRRRQRSILTMQQVSLSFPSFALNDGEC